VIKMQDVGPSTPAATGSDAAPASSASLTPAAAVKGNYLFADDTIASFFRFVIENLSLCSKIYAILLEYVSREQET
jgi:hypothetical protein